MASSPDSILEQWQGMIDDDFILTIKKTFHISNEDSYLYAAGSYQVTLEEVRSNLASGHYKWIYWSPEREKIQISDTDITAYTSIFASTTDTAKTLKSFEANAKQKSPRALVASHLVSKRLYNIDVKVPKLKSAHMNPYYDVWVWTCHNTRFLGPLPDRAYAHPTAASHSHPMLPVLYHHFGCVCLSYEALSIISQSVTTTKSQGVLEMASGNGYWTYMLRRMGVATIAVDNLEAKWRYMWIDDTIETNGVDFIKQKGGAKSHVLLMVYMVTKGNFTKQVLKAYRGNTIIIAGTQNANRYTGFQEATVEEYFEKEMVGWTMTARIALPSFAGKDEGMFVYENSKPLP